ncbi:FkbM family methyltransferase [Candidatus Methylomirabilis sp.]|uniref:FkbM family methyltransferase n=1 Tax=Candidatus Methylomirabilis sp. TaxID=2032687 RepID=UPI002A5C5000|nr:hypothetical protein [Candidatus Methylomirabilis sp.]
MNIRALPNTAEAIRLLSELATRRSEISPRPVDRPLVLYGAGKLGHLAADLFRRLGIPVAYALDRSPTAGGRLPGDIPIRRLDAVRQADRDSHMVAVCIVNAPYKPIRADLSAMGWRHIFPVYDLLETYTDYLPMGNGWFAGRLNGEDMSRTSAVLSGWSDDWSRAAHLQFMAWRLHREEWSFQNAPVRIDDRYFIEPVRPVMNENEYFLDAGAYHGDIADRWLNIMGGRFRAILAVEADRENIVHLRAWVASLPVEMSRRIQVQDCALAAESGIRSFSHGMDLASRIVNQADGNVRTCRLDDLNFPVTYGKIHLEGGELDALRGGLNILQRQRPMLAVTVYHNQDGLWRTPTFLMDTLQDYRFLMRLHAWCGTGAVLYAIPKERCCAA